MVKFLLSEEI